MMRNVLLDGTRVPIRNPPDLSYRAWEDKRPNFFHRVK